MRSNVHNVHTYKEEKGSVARWIVTELIYGQIGKNPGQVYGDIKGLFGLRLYLPKVVTPKIRQV